MIRVMINIMVGLAAIFSLILSLGFTLILLNGLLFPDPSSNEPLDLAGICFLGGMALFFLISFAAGIVFLARLRKYQKCE